MSETEYIKLEDFRKMVSERDRLKDIVANLSFALGCCAGFIRSKTPKTKANKEKVLDIIDTAMTKAQGDS